MDLPEELRRQLSAFDPTAATFNARTLAPADVVTSIKQFGCAWIKDLFDPARLGAFDRVIAANIEGVETVYRELGLPDGFNVGFPLYFAAERDRAKAQARFKASHPGYFDPARMGNAENSALPRFVFGALRGSGLDKAISACVGIKPIYTSAAICHIRSFKPSGGHWFGEFHQDNKLYDNTNEILTLWFPFRYQHGAMPSLEFLPVRLDKHLPTSGGCGIDNNLFSASDFWRPAYRLGDAMLLSGFVPHRTYVEPQMTLERTSVDFRFFRSAVPAPIYDGRVPTRSIGDRIKGRLSRLLTQ
jgi:hypothetical protein